MKRIITIVAILLFGCGAPVDATPIDYRESKPSVYIVHGPPEAMPITEPPESGDAPMRNQDNVGNGWSKTGLLTVGVPSAELSMQQNFGLENGGAGGDTYTLQFGVSPPASGVFNPEAVVTWCTAGVSLTRRISVGNGTSITGVAQSVIVKVADQVTAGLSIGEQYRVDMMVTRGSRASRMIPPVLGAGRATLAAGATAFFNIPQDAGVVMVTVTAFQLIALGVIADGDILGEVLDGAGTLLAGFAVESAGDSWIAIAPSATRLSLTNVSAKNALIANVIWGIDG